MNIKSPHRVTRCYTQHLVAPAARVFPLLCPVREADWIEGWDPLRVLSESGVAEPGCVFVTAADGRETLWYVSRHDAAAGVVEMIRFTPGVTVCRLLIELRDVGEGCTADIAYTHTSLGTEGDQVVDDFTEEAYVAFMRTWERRLNHYLETGRKLGP